MQHDTSPQIHLPGAAMALFFIALAFFVLGGLFLVGTRHIGFIEGGSTQAILALLMLVLGVCSLIGALVLVGVRAMLQQQTDSVMHTE